MLSLGEGAREVIGLRTLPLLSSPLHSPPLLSSPLPSPPLPSPLLFLLLSIGFEAL